MKRFSLIAVAAILGCGAPADPVESKKKNLAELMRELVRYRESAGKNPETAKDAALAERMRQKGREAEALLKELGGEDPEKQDDAAEAAAAAFAPDILDSVRQGRREGKKVQVSCLIRDLERAAKLYEFDYNSYPPEDGAPSFGTRTFAETLSQPGPKKQPYFEFSREDLNAAGDLINRCDPKDVIHYRNNAAGPKTQGGPPVHNKHGIDLWTSDGKSPTGINNWGAPE